MSTKILSFPRAAKSSLLIQQTSASVDLPRAPPCRRSISSSTDRSVQHSAEFSSTSASYDRLGRSAKDKLVDKDFFLSLLNSASTKREAKSYLARFKDKPTKTNQTPKAEPSNNATTQSLPSGVNLGSFYGASRSVYDSPVFRQDTTPTTLPIEPPERVHLALLKVSTPQLLDDSILDGVAKTLSQLSRLGMACCVVVDPGSAGSANELRKIAIEQAERMSRAVDAQPDSNSICLDSILSLSSSGTPTVLYRKGLLSPLRDGRTTIVTPVAYTQDTAKAVLLSANDAVLALTKELAGLAMTPDPDEDPILTAKSISGLQKEVSLDRIILLDPLGGIPAFSGPQTSHVFINMEQEFDDIEDELLRVQRFGTPDVQNSQLTSTSATSELSNIGAASPSATSPTSIADSNPLSKFINHELVSAPSGQPEPSKSTSPIQDLVNGHLNNLRLSQQALAMLPATSSGIITSPAEVANSAKAPHAAASDLSIVGTRRQRNPLIHSLLTDKPLLSSSLPMSRRVAANGSPSPISAPTSHTTFVKRGMPLTIFPNPWKQPWISQNRTRLSLNDPCIDLPRLVYLIEDSFNRKLDVQDYLNRVNDRLAGLIIAGEYEGGAILTWEFPPGVEDDGSEASASRMVPYLDKFAVLKRSQGAGGVADIVFNAMVRSCFPNGVCWRSRKDNPVNKWYFERSRGTWKLSDSNWLCSGRRLAYRRMRRGFGIMRLFVEVYSRVGRIRKVSLINWI
ncbi:hypothetical protein PHISCL_00603 [Aspergillus sclerotialis]|uniref:Amino-acid acetyltransferase, mitochondrial n=1 Tax=Aspergillus sclerotialis TaxID=2070753 RepID=A0A3A2ZV36_9EURO|nr:hypothetical protein PHISCL_00603 [Aspergillus sclerotialis]